MDNIENTDPQGAADVTATPGQSEDNTQPAETTTETPTENVKAEVEGEAEAVKAVTPWDNDPKFKGKSAEDIYQAYQESQKAIGQVSQKAEIANLIEQKYGLTPEQFKAQVEAQEHREKQQRYADNPLAPVLDEVQELRNRLEQQDTEKAYLEEEKVLDKFLSSEEGKAYAPYNDKIFKLGLGSEQDKSYDEIAKEWFGESRAQGQNDAYQRIETKKLTQLTGSQSSPQKKFSVEDMKGMTTAELEAILPHAPVR